MGGGVASWDYRIGDVREVLREMPEKSVQCIVTSPPYLGLRDYGIPPSIWGGDDNCTHEWGEEIIINNPNKNTWDCFDDYNTDGKPRVGRGKKDASRCATQGAYCHCGAWRGCLGLEPTPELYVEHMVEVCRALWRVLRDDGTFWLNLGDGYASGGRGSGGKATVSPEEANAGWHSPTSGLKHKDLVMMPARVVLALQADGWTVRSKIIWFKPNPMPESCTDRPTSSYEEIFELTKKARYFYDADAVREPHKAESIQRYKDNTGITIPEAWKQEAIPISGGKEDNWNLSPGGRNLRNVLEIEEDEYAQFLRWKAEMAGEQKDVWKITTQSYAAAHFATFPEKIPETCIKAGTSERGCCPSCGAPWERVVEKVASLTTIQPHGPKDKERGEQGLRTSARMGGGAGWRKRGRDAVDEWKKSCGADKNGEYHGKAIKDYEGTGAEDPSDVKARILRGMVPKITSGFQPTCECGGEPVPSVVLDPFAGSGTTLKVARDLGRSAIGIDISEDYKKLAEERASLHTKDVLSYVI